MSEVKIPEGYKQTEVGVIPEDWEVTTIGSFAPLQRGFDLPTTKVEAGYYPVVYSNGIVRNHKTFQVRGAGVVTGRSGTIGKVHYIENDFWPHNTTLWVTSFGNAHVKFVYYLFRYIGFERFKSGSGVPTLNRNDAHSFKITVPTNIKEQTAIATALSDVDNLIQSLEKLIAKKKAIKTGTMQQLLTGKTRLPEFATRKDGSLKGFKQTELGMIPEDWDVISLGTVSNFINGRAYSIHEWENIGIPVIRLQNLTGRGETYYYSNLKLPEKQYCENGDLLFMWSATFGPVIWKGPKAIYHYHIWKVECNSGYNQTYLFHLLSDMTEKLKQGSSSGGTMLHITKQKMESIKAAFPSEKEQTAIATIIFDMDIEIQALQDRLEKTKQIKQGMMQQLLTGKVRLVNHDDEQNTNMSAVKSNH
ncbi:restriction endonuclease subunit S [Psychrobacter arenosus]|uniref:restriction endonuclease subunit S n=1 Tax=Psychrobacter arenosus TaxID=256326 RepID=UPI001917C478|nr:restriction endonuclease subunit S [Psychrobacter arenosus]